MSDLLRNPEDWFSRLYGKVVNSGKTVVGIILKHLGLGIFFSNKKSLVDCRIKQFLC